MESNVIADQTKQIAKKAGSRILKNVIMFLILVAYVGIVAWLLFETFPIVTFPLYVGIPLAFVYSMVCFFSKKLRSPLIIWWGILSLATAAYWIYLLVSIL